MTKPVAVNQAMQQMGLKFHNIIIQRLIPLIIRRDSQMRLPFRQKMIAPTSTTKKPSPILFKELSPLLILNPLELVEKVALKMGTLSLWEVGKFKAKDRQTVLSSYSIWTGICVKRTQDMFGNCFFPLFSVSKNSFLFLKLKILFDNPKWI